jgi:hypothetical protein
LRFNVNDINGAVTKSILRLYTTSSSSTGYQVRSVGSNTWDEKQINYANAPAIGSVINSSGKFSSGSWVSVDVTSLINNAGVYDLAVTPASTSSMSFNSRDASSFQPQLVIQTSTTTTPTATPTATVIFTSTSTVTNTNVPINTPTSTLMPTATPTSVIIPTDTPTSALVPTATPTSVIIPTDTPTSTLVPTATPTSVIIPTNTPTPIPHTPVFNDGFETGNLSSWNSSAGLVVQPALVHSGNFAAQGNTMTGNTYAKKTFPTGYSDSYSRIYFNLVSYTSQVNLLRYRTSADASIGYLFVNTLGKLGLRNDVAAVITTSATTVSSGWHALEFHVTINGNLSITEVWLDGIKINDLSITTNLGSNLVGGLQIGEVQSGRTYNVILDDVIFDTQYIGL